MTSGAPGDARGVDGWGGNAHPGDGESRTTCKRGYAAGPLQRRAEAKWIG